MINTFKISFPVQGETLNMLFFLFRGHVIENGSRPSTYSIVCRIDGMKIILTDAVMLTWHGKGKPLTDVPVIKRNQIYFSNYGQRAASLQLKINNEAEDAYGNIISIKCLVELKYSPLQFIVCGLQSQYSVKRNAIYPEFKEKQPVRILQTG